ncbi:DMT family transporter [Fervidibacillus albus]|uniref:DMT family transporter n=1 Tax=Fervidibacillus albus TaxID=2980026 RepID=A0A9E8LX30_9BACI|nr:DMT family transporter [Fervidibacillus albus]WAA11262.1 DMT family transporter [Fervidibacillus albus]
MTAKRFFTHPVGIMISASLATFLWGSAFPFIKLSYELLDIHSNEIGEQILFAGYRFFLASMLIFLFFLFRNREMRFRQDTLKPVIKIGLFQTFLQYVFFYIGLSMSTGIQGSIIAGTTSFFQMVLAHILYPDDRMNRRKTVGLIVGFLGVIAVNLTKGDFQLQIGFGEILLLFAMFSGGFGNILAKEGAKRMEIAYLTSYQMLFGSIGLLMIGIIQVGPFPFSVSFTSLFILFYLAFLSAAGFILWNNVMKYNQVGKVSIYLFLVPVFGTFLSAILLGEELHLFVFIGLALVTAGIWIINKPKK